MSRADRVTRGRWYTYPTLQDLLDERDIADGDPLLETDDPAALLAYLRTAITRTG